MSEHSVRPAAMYTSDPDEWSTLDWYDRASGERVGLTALTPHDADFYNHLEQGRVRVRTLGDALTEFRHRPEHKSLASDGVSVARDSAGLLTRRPIESAPVLTDLIGKEGNDLAERGSGALVDLEDSIASYGNRGDRWTELVLPVLREMGVAEVMQRTGRGRSAVYDVLSGKVMKYATSASRYVNAAVDFAMSCPRIRLHRRIRHPFGALYAYLRLSSEESIEPQ